MKGVRGGPRAGAIRANSLIRMPRDEPKLASKEGGRKVFKQSQQYVEGTESNRGTA